MTKAAKLLATGMGILDKRAAEYDRKDGPDGEPGERSAASAVRAFNAITGRDLKESEGWLFLSLLKLVRLQTAPGPHDDSATDAAVYAAIMGESKHRAAGVKSPGKGIGFNDPSRPGVPCPETGDPKCPAQACPPQCPAGPQVACGSDVPEELDQLLREKFGPNVRVFPMEQMRVGFVPPAPTPPADAVEYAWGVWCPVNGWLRVPQGTSAPGTAAVGAGNWTGNASDAVRFTDAADAVKEAKKWNNAQVRSILRAIGGSR